jgi:hypothetical protein
VSDGTNGLPPDDPLVAAVEAVLFAAGEPVHPREIAAAFEGESEERIEEAIEALERRHAESDCQRRHRRQRESSNRTGHCSHPRIESYWRCRHYPQRPELHHLHLK